MSGIAYDPEVAQATQRTFGTPQPQGSSTDPEVAQATSLSFPDAYNQSGLPEAYYPAAYADFGQESSYGKADPANPMRITSATAANPGYGLPAFDPKDLTNPAMGQQNLIRGLRYQAALAKAKGYDLTTPAGAAAALTAYNGGGDPNYVQHVAARMGTGAASAPGVQVAQNGASDVDSPGVSQASQQLPQGQVAQQRQAPQLAYTPPPMPLGLQQSLNQTGGFGQTAGSRGLYALAGGLLTGRTFGQGLGLGLQSLDQQRQQDQRNALEAYTLENQQAMYGLNAQRFGAQIGIQQQNADTKSAGQQATAGYQQGKLGLSGEQLLETTRHHEAGEALGGQKNAIGAANAGAHITSANAAALAAGSPTMSQPQLPGVGMAPVGPGPAQPPAGGAAPTFAATGTSPPPGMPQLPPQAPQQASQQPPQQAPQAGPAGLPPGALQPRPQMPQQVPQAAPGGPSGALPVSPTGQPTQGPQATSTGLPGMGASGLPSAGSNLTPLVGTRAQNQQRILNNRATAKESDEDTAAIESAAKQNAMLTTQVGLIDKQNQDSIFGTGGLGGRIANWTAGLTGNSTVGGINKEGGGLLIGALPHGVGALRIPEIHAAKQTTPGMDTPQAIAHLIKDQTVAQNNETSDVLQARQAWIAGHPGESASVGFDPIGNDYFRSYPAYSEQGGQAVPTQRPSVADFTRQHVDSSGRYVGLNDPEVQQAGAKAFPQAATGTPQGPAPAGATPPGAGAQSGGAASLPTLAPNQKAWLLNQVHNTPGFRDKFVQQYGQAALGALN